MHGRIEPFACLSVPGCNPLASESTGPYDTVAVEAFGDFTPEQSPGPQFGNFRSDFSFVGVWEQVAIWIDLVSDCSF